MLDQNTQKNEMETENCIVTKRIVKAAEWNPELSTKYRTYRAIGRPRRRCEDEINEFLKSEEVEIEMTTRNHVKHNNAWVGAAKKPRKVENNGE